MKPLGILFFFSLSYVLLFSFVLRAAFYRYCTIKSHNGKSRCRRYKLQKSLLYSMGLLHHTGTYCACTHAYIPVSTILQDNVMQLSKLLVTGYQFSSVRIPIVCCGRVTRCSISSFVTAGLRPRTGCRGGRVSETKGNALALGRPR